jgi:hypothetical protein
MQSKRLFVLFLLCSSCTSIYIPTARNIPLFSGKGDFQGTASIGNGINVQAAYSPFRHLAVAVNGLAANNKLWPQFGYRTHQSAEFALGYYTNRKFLFEIFGGYGNGRGEGRDSSARFIFFPSVLETAAGQYNKYFLQPTIGLSRKRLQYALSVRLSYVDFKSISLATNNHSEEVEKRPIYFLEPSFTFKFFTTRRPTGVFIFGQAGLNLPMGNHNDIFFRYSILHYNVGVGIRITHKSDQD